MGVQRLPKQTHWIDSTWRLHYLSGKICQRIFKALSIFFRQAQPRARPVKHTQGSEMTPDRHSRSTQWHIGAATTAWLVPGMGHVLLGERRRGAVLGVTIAVLWLMGLIIGGLSVCDRREHPAWFLGQMLTAPSLAVNHYVQSLKHENGQPPSPYAPHGYEPSYGRMGEQGILYTSLAGLLNLLAIIDVVYRSPWHRAVLAQEPEGSEPAGGGA